MSEAQAPPGTPARHRQSDAPARRLGILLVDRRRGVIFVSKNRLLLSACFVYTIILEWVGPSSATGRGQPRCRSSACTRQTRRRGGDSVHIVRSDRGGDYEQAGAVGWVRSHDSEGLSIW